MRELPGYRDFELLDENIGSKVYRARRTVTDERAIVKILNVEDPSPAEVVHFRHKCELIRKIDLDGVVRVLDVISAGGVLALAVEDFGGVPLKRNLSGPASVPLFLEMAIRLTETVKALHERNITHGNIKPANVLYNPEKDLLKMADFGFAAELARVYEHIYHPGVLDGVLVYMSPEQTGRMNCSVDYRTDFYSLGATFYEMLTGGVPFTGKDPMEIFHAHLAKMPVPPHKINPLIPEAVSCIIMKLLAKTAEERYQSGQGLLSDLRNCQTQIAASNTIETFDLGQSDISFKFNLTRMLVGRTKELDTIYQTFERAALGEVEVLVVSGEPGVGKSALVNELHKPVVAQRGYFATGKYDPMRRSVPYSGIIQALMGLTRQLLTESEKQIEAWKEKLVAALGVNGRIITDIIGDMELIIGRQPDIAELEPEESRNRFKIVLGRFMRVFAASEHPLVLFLDDLQWADPASLELIRILILDGDLRHLFLIGAYRSTEVAAHHPLMLSLDQLRSTAISLTTISLGPLEESDINALLVNILRCDPAVSSPLAAIAHAKTLGNPFFFNQFLKRLHDAGYLNLDPAVGWQWDTAAIEQMQVTDNVVTFVTEKLRDLPADLLTLLRTGACIGNRFDAESLADLSEKTLDEVLDAIDALVQDGLITYSDMFCRFPHDRIREAAYSLLSQEEKRSMHYRIGCLTLERTPTDTLPYHVFYIADQLNQAHDLLQTGEECLRLVEINLMAGIKAKDATAYDAAVAYLNAGLELLPQAAWSSNYRLAYNIHVELMECRHLARNFDKAERLFEIIVAKAADKIDKANAYNTMIVLYTNTRGPEDAITLGISALKLFGVNLSLKKNAGKVLKELIKVKMKLRKMPLHKILELPPMVDEERKAYHNLLFNIGTPAYFFDPNFFAFLVLKGINESFQYGLPKHAAVTLITVATIFENVLGDYTMGYELGKIALELNRKLDNRKLEGMMHHIFAFFIQHWHRHAKHDLPYFQKVYRLCLDYGNFIYAGHSINASADCRLMIGDSLDAIQKDNEKYVELMHLVKDPFIFGRYQENTQIIRALKGLNDDPVSLTGDGFDFEAHLAKLRKENNVYGLCFALLNKVKLLYLFGRYDDARQAAEELDLHIKAPIGTMVVSEHYFYYSLILAAVMGSASSFERRKMKRIIRRNQRKLSKWADLCPENFRHKYDLVRAELCSLGNKGRQVPVHYHQAIRGAKETEYVNDEALACERAALFYYRFDAHEEARTFMRHAHRCYGDWGAAAKQRELEERYGALLTGTIDGTPKEGVAVRGMEITSRKLDLETVMAVSQTISSEIMLDLLLKKIMQLSIVNAGAQRGFLILKKEGVLNIEACEDPLLDPFDATFPKPLNESEGLCHAVVHFVSRRLEPIILANAVREGAFSKEPYIVNNQCKSILCMPILNKGILSGILYMENNLTANAFTPERLEILGIIAAQAAISLENARLFELATTDGLTKLFVHRYFQLLLDNEIERSLRYNRTFSLVMMDIDDFKHFNDSYGHQIGDEVLKRVGRVLRENLRPIDVAARYGGEEFVLILPETEVEQALVVCEKIRKLVQAMPIPYSGKNLKVTISLGAAAFPHHATEKGGLVNSADRALYASKIAGKNRVSVGDKSASPDRCPLPDQY